MGAEIKWEWKTPGTVLRWKITDFKKVEWYGIWYLSELNTTKFGNPYTPPSLIYRPIWLGSMHANQQHYTNMHGYKFWKDFILPSNLWHLSLR